MFLWAPFLSRARSQSSTGVSGCSPCHSLALLSSSSPWPALQADELLLMQKSRQNHRYCPGAAPQGLAGQPCSAVTPLRPVPPQPSRTSFLRQGCSQQDWRSHSLINNVPNGMLGCCQAINACGFLFRTFQCLVSAKRAGLCF